MSEERIALGSGVSRPTLAKHFGGELTRGVCQRWMDVLVAQFQAASGGT